MSIGPVFRFAPSTTGHLHIGHAYSALFNAALAEKSAGTFLIRIEDTDITRCTSALQTAALEDLAWIGLKWPKPLIQTQRFSAYQNALEKLRQKGLTYPSYLSRTEIRKAVARTPDWPVDPDGSPLYPGFERNQNSKTRQSQPRPDKPYAIRLNMEKAMASLSEPLIWRSVDGTPRQADPARWGDVIIARKDTPTSYHLSVVVDDAFQKITHVVRGMDLYFATDIQCLLQHLLELPCPLYHHHQLVLDKEGQKLSKSRHSTSLRSLRQENVTPDEIMEMINWDADEITRLSTQIT